MFINERYSGSIGPADLVRMPAGSFCIYEINDPSQKSAIRAKLTRYADAVAAKIQVTVINGFDRSSNPRYMLRVDVLEQGEPLKGTV